MTGEENNIPPPGNTENIPPILNACLAFMRFHMTSRDKLYIQDATCARFSLNVLKQAHEVLFKGCHPTAKYIAVRGPNKGGPREKSIFFFEECFKKLVDLDQKGLQPIIACPSDELYVFLGDNGSYDHKLNENRFAKLEKSMDEMSTVLATIMSGGNPPGLPAPTVLPKQSVLAEASVVPTTSTLPAPAIPSNMHMFRGNGRIRADSTSSAKRDRSDDEDLDKSFTEVGPRNRSKKVKTNNTKSFSSVAQANGPPKSTVIRRQANWGKATNSKPNELVGAVPELFIFNCAGRPDEHKVKKYLESKDLMINKVTMMSQPDAYKRSFRVSVATCSDYDKLLSGEPLPPFVGVKKFIFGRNNRSNSDQWSLGKKESDVINDFINQSNTERSLLSNLSAAQGGLESDQTISKIIGTPEVNSTAGANLIPESLSKGGD